jgi:hypothetical protein
MNYLLYIIILVVVLIMILASTRARALQFRRIPAYTALPLLAGEAVESGRSVHLSFGSSAVRDATTLAALASAEIIYHLAERASLGDRPTFVTLSDPVTLALGQDTLRRAYKARAALRSYRSTMAQWYPQGPSSFAFAAGAGAEILDADASLNVLIGRYGAEMMLLAENAVRYDRTVVGQSDQVIGQAVAYAVSDTLLIGEELYVGGAYLARTPLLVGGVFAQDLLRFLVITVIIGLAILALVGTSF